LKRSMKWALGALAAGVCVLGYLLATGERGLFATPPSARVLEAPRLDHEKAGRLGWRTDGLEAVFEYSATLSTDSLVIMTDGEVVASFGQLDRRYRVHSIRKAFLSAVIGQHLGESAGKIPLSATLHDLKIDDSPLPLTARQKTATVEHLLKSLSGINHPAAAEAGLTAEKDRLLGNEENTPGEKWAYNNWDYNALTTIFEDRTGRSVADAFMTGIAQSTGMQDIPPDSISYQHDASLSQHRAVAFRMSARDLARFGQLYLDGGRVADTQVIPAAWAARVSNDYTKTGRDDLRWGHGYLWWIPGPETALPKGSYWAWGLGNQAVMVIPEWKTVIVHQSDTTAFLERFLSQAKSEQTMEDSLLELILSCKRRANRTTEYCVEHRFTSRPEIDEPINRIADARVQ